MAETYSAGIVTAYGAAVRGGYTGTYEQFCAEQASFAASARQVAEDRAAVEQLAETFEDQTVPAAVGQVNQAGAAQVQAIQAAGADEESDISAAGSTQVQAVQAAGSTQIQAVQTAGATQIQAVEDKGDEVIASIPQDYSALSGEVADLKSATDDMDCLSIATYKLVNGNQSNSDTWNQVTTNQWKHYAIKVNPNDIITMAFSAVITIGFLKTYSVPTTDGQTIDYSSATGFTTKVNVGTTPTTYKVPSDSHYLVIENFRSNTLYAINQLTINGYDLLKSLRENIVAIENKMVKSSRPKWFALGDSITAGLYSADGEIVGGTQFNYVYYVALYNNYDATNYGVGGAGYLRIPETQGATNAKGTVDSIDFSDCDLCTLAYGVNDWHYGMEIGTVNDDPSGGDTMASNMKYCIEKILTDNPLCKIIVLFPLNNSAYGTGNTKANNWGLGATVATSGTLQDTIDVEKDICEYYGIDYIDQSKTSVVNRENIESVLGDGTHPVLDLYPVLGAELARQINFA